MRLLQNIPSFLASLTVIPAKAGIYIEHAICEDVSCERGTMLAYHGLGFGMRGRPMQE